MAAPEHTSMLESSQHRDDLRRVGVGSAGVGAARAFIMGDDP